MTLIKTILSSDDPIKACRDLLRPIFTQGPECQVIFDRLFAKIESVEENEDGSWGLSLLNDQDESCALSFDPAYKGKPQKNVPPSFLALVRNFNGITYDGYIPMGLNGLTRSGSILDVCGGWDAEALKEGENEGFLEQLEEVELTEKDVPGPIDFFQNWIILHPAETNQLGEMMPYFVSHEDCEAVRIDSAEALAWGPLMLRILAQAILTDDNDFLPEVYD